MAKPPLEPGPMRSFWKTHHDISLLPNDPQSPPTLEMDIDALVNTSRSDREFQPAQPELPRIVSAREGATQDVSARQADRLSRLESERASWMEQSKRYDAAIAAQRQEIIRLKNEKAVLEESAKQSSSRLRAVESRNHSLELRLRAELKAKDAAQATLIRVSQQHDNELRELARRYQDEIAELETLHDVGAQKLMQDHEVEMDGLRTFYAQKLSNLRLQHEQESDCARSWHDQAVADLREEFDELAEAMRREVVEREEAVRVENAKEVSRLREELEKLNTTTSTEDRASQPEADLEGSSHQRDVALLRRERHEQLFTKSAREAEISKLQQQVKELQEDNAQLGTINLGLQEIKSRLERFRSTLPLESHSSTPAFTPSALPTEDDSTRSTSVQSALPPFLRRLSSTAPSAPTPPMQEVLTPVQQVQRPPTSWVKPELMSPVSLAQEPMTRDQRDGETGLASPSAAENIELANDHGTGETIDQLDTKPTVGNNMEQETSTVSLDDLFTPPPTSGPTFTSLDVPLSDRSTEEPVEAGPSRLSHISPAKSKAKTTTTRVSVSIDANINVASHSHPRSSSAAVADRRATDATSTAGPSRGASAPLRHARPGRPRGPSRKSTSASATSTPTPLPALVRRRSSSRRIDTKPKANALYDGEYEVEAIVGEHTRKMPDGSTRTAYKIHWKGFPLDQESLIWADEVENDEEWDRMYAHFLARNSGDAKRQRFVRVAK